MRPLVNLHLFVLYRFLSMEGEMRMVSSIFCLVCLASSAWAVPATASAPEIDTGILGIAAAAGVVYLTKQFKRS